MLINKFIMRKLNNQKNKYKILHVKLCRCLPVLLPYRFLARNNSFIINYLKN
jgi:hypothetical protein